MSRTNANDLAWEKAFLTLDLLPAIRSQGWVDVTARDLRQFREPRLMAKIDYSNNRPEIFRSEGVNILALSSAHYRIGKFKIFQDLPDVSLTQKVVERVELPPGIQSLAFMGLTSESAVVTSAFAAGILEKFCGEELLLTSFGRMRTPQFDFSISGLQGEKYKLEVDSATIEIDAAFENSQAFHILEVKNHRPADFNIRQLYYPYRTWNTRIQKPVESVFVTYSNDVFDLFKISFTDPLDFSSSVIGEHKRFMVAEGTIRLQDLEEVAHRKSQSGIWNTGYRNKIPFPQADSFARVVDLVSLLLDQPMSLGELTEHYGFDSRQSDYYYNAARYLGLATSTRDDVMEVEVREPTPEARRIFSMPYREKFLALAELVLSIQPINQAFSFSTTKSEIATAQSIQEIFGKSSEARDLGYSASTIKRRSQTITAWVNWLTSLAEA